MKKLLQEVLIETEEASKQEFINALKPFMDRTVYKPLLPVCNRIALEKAYKKGLTRTIHREVFLMDGKRPVARFNNATLKG